MTQTSVLREQRLEMSNTFAAIRQKIVDAQASIRSYNNKAKDLEKEKEKADKRYEEARAKCTKLRHQVADKERDLWDVENQIPMAKSKMHELESIYGENKHFEKLMEETRKELVVVEKRKADVHQLVKKKAEDCWQATQKLHKLELRIEEVDKRIDFAISRIIVAHERMAAMEVQGSSLSIKYKATSKTEMESKIYELQLKLSQAKERRKKSEEEVLKLSFDVEELEKEIEMYHSKMREMFSGQRELASSKLL